ncbi:MAG: 23S rRNA (uracil(1939)-C(5))-methyltransferase RlmD, partial [Lachnospiraceae bacterium]|nr:23S rRNA (uracil(1939)-C(5))-methyltransferase RlmD [Lachnospiraceae bacterium]
MADADWKKGNCYEGTVTDVRFPNKGVVRVEGIDGYCIVKHVVTGEKVSFCVTKRRKGHAEGRLLAVSERAECEVQSTCPHFEECGGCTYRTLPYDKQLTLKENQVHALLADLISDEVYLPILASPVTEGYRNKMEFSFGDSVKDGPLELGLHKRGSFYDVLSVTECRIVDDDYRKILGCTLDHFRKSGLPFYHKLRHEGFLRHLLVRKAAKTGEILIDLVTASGDRADSAHTDDIINNYVNQLTELALDGRIVGILHTVNDALSDTIRNDGTQILYGQDHFYEELLGLRFLITPFSFFQTNTRSAEVLYTTVRELVCGTGELNNSVIYDLYSGTGTIAQILAPVAKRVIGVEIVAEAVEAAKANAELNGLHNCEFVAGDVLKVLDDIEEKPDFIVLDPPRDGIHPKALNRIIAYGVPNIVYISCKPTSLARDLPAFLDAGYSVRTVRPIDQFPYTVHVETVALLSKLSEAKHFVNIKVEMDEMDLTCAESKATYREIAEWVQE